MLDLVYIIPLLLLSVALNIFLLWYTRRMMSELYHTSENIGDLTEEVLLFDGHLKSLHDMEIFYGDETLQSLMGHSNSLIETLEDFREIYALFNTEREEELTEEADLGKKEEK
tara:strand:+ start:3460 stop:3798 length:339 start_codon:yes stop_codon:yes gene_type:complete